MASNVEYKAASHLSDDVEEGELSSGRSSPGTIRENASECSTQTDDCNDTVTTMTVEVDNANTSQRHHNRTVLHQPTPMEIAGKSLSK